MEATVAIPAYKSVLTPDEEMSLASCRRQLGKHAIFLVLPEDLPEPSWKLQSDRLVRFPSEFFTYPHGYNRLLMSRDFYQAFAGFDYVLVFQLDSLVFRDELKIWCNRKFDYVGAPWFDDYLSPGKKCWSVGNGGFSLRKVSAALEVLRLPVVRGSLYPVPMPGHPQPRGFYWIATNIQRRLRQHLGLWTVEDELANCDANEDRFWSFVAPRLNPKFSIPSVEVALEFAFELRPRECLEKTKGKIPFGCHAWANVDRAFWEEAMQGE